MGTRATSIAAALLAGAVAAVHLLFGIANFGLARDEEAFFSVPLGEGVLALVAATGIGAAAVLIVRRRLFRASVVTLLGTMPLAIWFAFTVPEHSDRAFFFASPSFRFLPA